MNKAVVHINKWLNMLYKALAILLVLFAVLLSALRIFLPYAHTYKQDVEDYLNSGYKGKIEIGELTAGWQNLGPTLIINDIVLTNSSAISVVIDEMDIGLDFWDSIKNQTIKATNFTLIGADILIDQTLIFAEQPNEKSEASTDLNAISDLMLKQVKRFSLLDSTLRLKTPFKDHKFTIEKLAWLNENEHHQGIGKVQAFNFPENTAKLIVDLHGINFSDLAGQIYMEGRGLNLTPLFDKYLGDKGDQIDSDINFQSWLDIENGRSKSLQLQFDESSFSWNSFEQQHTLTIPKNQISFSRDGLQEHYFFQSSPIDFKFNGESWGDLTLQGEFDRQSWQTNIDEMSVTKLWQLFPLVIENLPQLAVYQPLNLHGQLSQIMIQGKGDQFKANVLFDDFGMSYAEGIPGIDNLSGDLLFENQQLSIEFLARDNAIDFANGFSRPIPFEQLSGHFAANWDELQWKIIAENLRLNSTELTLKGDVQYLQVKDQIGELSIFAFLNDVDASKTQYYLPLSIMDEGLVDYLNKAIYSGTVSQASVIVNGPVSNFPFTDNSGVFVVDADLVDAKYRFEESWPVITQMEANLNFFANSMLITATGGDLSGVKLTDVSVGIDDFTTSILTVDTPVSGDLLAVQELMLASPLANTVGETIKFIGPSGNVSGVFSLELPLNDTSLAVAKGDFTLSDNRVELTAPEMSFSQVNGSIRFVNEVITTKDLSVVWRDMPLDLDVVTDVKDTHYQVDIGLSGHWQKQHYAGQIPTPLQGYLNGDLDWQGDLSLFIPDDGDLTYTVDIESDLNKAHLLLPQPFTKPAEQKVALLARAEGNSRQSNITLSVGDKLSFYGDLNHQDPSFIRSHLIIGNEEMLLPMDGFHITTALDHISFEQWYPFINDIVASLPDGEETVQSEDDSVATSTSLISIPERVRGNVGNVEFYGQNLSDLSFNLLYKADHWLLQLNSEQLRSRFRFYHDYAEKGIAIDADFVNFSESFSFIEDDGQQTAKTKYGINAASAKAKLSEIELTPSDIPNIAFNCGNCQYKQLNLGAVKFSLIRETLDKVILKDFSAERKGTKLTANAQWLKTQNSDKTTLTGKLSSKDIEQEIEAFGFESTIKDSGFKSDFTVDWQGGPDKFNFDSLNGKVKVDFDDGYLADVSDKGARIFSLFSLQSLVRKLTLDFRDVFSKGMFYNSIKANFNFVNGIVYTDNMRMDATAGNLSVKGNTNLVTQQLDYKMSFSPKVTSSLPVIIGWLVNPLMGVAILAADEAIQKAEVISFINFELTGTLADPNFKEVDRKSRDISVGKSKPDSKKTQPKPQGDAVKPDSKPIEVKDEQL